MASAHPNDITPPQWQYLVELDKRPTPLFEHLLLALAAYIKKHIAPWDVEHLTPAKLCNFYRSVGGDYDTLFLHTAHASLSFIYRSLGCFHTLQPSANPYLTPTIPALTQSGFVRWQTIQLLLDPADHGKFLQESVKRFNLTHSINGQPFPVPLPRDVLPPRPDPEMITWYHGVADKLKTEAEACRNKPSLSQPPLPALSSADDSSRPVSSDSDSVDTQSLLEASAYFHEWRLPHHKKPGTWGRGKDSLKSQQRSHSVAQVLRSPRWRSGIPDHTSATSHPLARNRSSSPDSLSSCSSDCSSCSSRSLSPSLAYNHARKKSASRPRAATTSRFNAPPPRSYSYGQLAGSVDGRGRTCERSRQHPTATLRNWPPTAELSRKPNFKPPEIRGDFYFDQKRPVPEQAGLSRAKTLGARPNHGRLWDVGNTANARRTTDQRHRK